jgi:hypothetical protein
MSERQGLLNKTEDTISRRRENEISQYGSEILRRETEEESGYAEQTGRTHNLIPSVMCPSSLWEPFVSLQDDVISISTKKFIFIIIFIMIFWIWSYILVILELISEYNNTMHRFTHHDYLLFLPMWIGSILGIIFIMLISYGMCYQVSLISRDRRISLNTAANHSTQYIEYESLPLMRRLLAWIASTFITLILCFISQILFYLWYIHDIWTVYYAVMPIMFLSVVYMIYMYIMEIFDLWACITYTCLVVGLVSNCIFVFLCVHHKI